jgi:hypothetical protein
MQKWRKSVQDQVISREIEGQGLVTGLKSDVDAIADPIAAAVQPTTPIDASGSAAAVAFRTTLFQLLIAAGALVKWIRFFNRVEAVPIVIALATVGFALWQNIRAVAKHIKLQVLSLLVPQKVAISPPNPPAAVAKAAEAATLLIEQDPARPVAPSQSARATYPGSGT